jgi:signal transduction histidine kinase
MFDTHTDATHETIARLASFNRNVSHELRTGLAGIQGLADATLARLRRGDTDGSIAYLELISRQAQASIDLVASLLQLAQAQQSPLALQALELDDSVREAIALVSGALPEAARVRWHIGSLPRLPAADALLMRQVFVNLIGNAVKFSAKAESPIVRLHGQHVDGAIELTVEDNGIGFDSGSADLFEPFRRLHGQRYKGSGVGLSIVRSILDRHGARIEAHSRPNEGARFTIRWPGRAAAPRD